MYNNHYNLIPLVEENNQIIRLDNNSKVDKKNLVVLITPPKNDY